LPGKKTSPDNQPKDGGLSVTNRFLDDLPRLYREKEEQLIKEMRDKISLDEESSLQFDAIVRNTKQTFKEKLDALRELSLQVKSKDAAEYARRYVVEKLTEIRDITDRMEKTNENLTQDLQMFTFESNQELI